MEEKKQIEMKQATQPKLEIHNLFGFVIIAQQNFDDTNEVICLEHSSIDLLIKHLQKIKAVQMN